mmetsp:Transcript_30642/g.43979  ORF Transcript_30642/g.43979 Transcript_30642/m.43979 type:complete len:93 (-) Transcript_30642:201-479(-)
MDCWIALWLGLVDMVLQLYFTWHQEALMFLAWSNFIQPMFKVLPMEIREFLGKHISSIQNMYPFCEGVLPCGMNLVKPQMTLKKCFIFVALL